MTFSSMKSMVPVERIELPTFGLQNRTISPLNETSDRLKYLVLKGFSGFYMPGKGGGNVGSERLRQPQNQDHLFPARSRECRA